MVIMISIVISGGNSVKRFISKDGYYINKKHRFGYCRQSMLLYYMLFMTFLYLSYFSRSDNAMARSRQTALKSRNACASMPITGAMDHLDMMPITALITPITIAISATTFISIPPIFTAFSLALLDCGYKHLNKYSTFYCICQLFPAAAAPFTHYYQSSYYPKDYRGLDY